MYDQHNVPPPEFRVRPVVNYVVTKYCHPYTHKPGPECGLNEKEIPFGGGSVVVCEVVGESDAYDIARALANAEYGKVVYE